MELGVLPIRFDLLTIALKRQRSRFLAAYLNLSQPLRETDLVLGRSDDQAVSRPLP